MSVRLDRLLGDRDRRGRAPGAGGPARARWPGRCGSGAGRRRRWRARGTGRIDHLGRWLGIGLAGLVNIFDPRIIVLGGRFARLAPYVSATVEAELDRHALAAPRDLVRVVPATLGDQASLLGAAELAMEPLLADPAAWLGPRSGDAQRDGTSPTNGDWRVVA